MMRQCKGKDNTLTDTFLLYRPGRSSAIIPESSAIIPESPATIPESSAAVPEYSSTVEEYSDQAGKLGVKNKFVCFTQSSQGTQSF